MLKRLDSIIIEQLRYSVTYCTGHQGFHTDNVVLQILVDGNARDAALYNAIDGFVVQLCRCLDRERLLEGDHHIFHRRPCQLQQGL